MRKAARLVVFFAHPVYSQLLCSYTGLGYYTGIRTYRTPRYSDIQYRIYYVPESNSQCQPVRYKSNLPVLYFAFAVRTINIFL